MTTPHTFRIIEHVFTSVDKELTSEDEVIADLEAVRKWRRIFRKLGRRVLKGKVRGSQEARYANTRPIFKGQRRTQLVKHTMTVALGNWRDERFWDTLHEPGCVHAAGGHEGECQVSG